MLDFIIVFLITLVVFFAIDLVWLGVVARPFYQAEIGHLLKKDVNWTAAIIFYLIFIVGLIVFVILPAMENKNIVEAIFKGALFGFVTYATYDLTNLATLKDWPLKVTIVDLVWGTVLASSVSTISFLLSNLLLRK